MARRVRPEKKIPDIVRYVGLGHSQSAANCRVLLAEIERLRAHNRKLEQTILDLLAGDIERGNVSAFTEEDMNRLKALVEEVKIDRNTDVINGDVGL